MPYQRCPPSFDGHDLLLQRDCPLLLQQNQRGWPTKLNASATTASRVDPATSYLHARWSPDVDSSLLMWPSTLPTRAGEFRSNSAGGRRKDRPRLPLGPCEGSSGAETRIHPHRPRAGSKRHCEAGQGGGGWRWRRWRSSWWALAKRLGIGFFSLRV